jgi:hypothetical protein
MTSDAGTVLPKRKVPPPTLPPSCDPLPIRAFGAAGMQNASEQHFSLPNGDHPDAEAPGWSITVLPVKGDHPAHPALARASFSGETLCEVRTFRIAFDELIESQARGSTPRRVSPAINPKCHSPNGPIRCGSAGEELTLVPSVLADHRGDHSPAPGSFIDPFLGSPSLGNPISGVRCEPRRYSSPECLVGPAAPLLR